VSDLFPSNMRLSLDMMTENSVHNHCLGVTTAVLI